MSTTAVPGARGTEDNSLARTLASPMDDAAQLAARSRGRARRPARALPVPRSRRHRHRAHQADPVIELLLTLAAVLATLTAVAFLLPAMVNNLGDHARHAPWPVTAGAVVFDVCVFGLVLSNLVYQANRWGVHRRRLQPLGFHRSDETRLAALYSPDADPGLVTILVPAYKEDPGVVRQTLLSAALQDVPRRRVVLCLDDPPRPTAADDISALALTRGLPDELMTELHRAAQRLDPFLTDDDLANLPGAARMVLRERALALSRAYAELASILLDWAAASPAATHTDRLFTKLTFVDRAAEASEQADSLRQRGVAGKVSPDELDGHHTRLRQAFTVEITAFERKRYVNLSHEPNKAMNLNAYIALVGHNLREKNTAEGRMLLMTDEAYADLRVPASRWLLTLDADSLLRHDYARILVAEMLHPAHARTAVIQTPYVATPGAPGVLERTAGATTDIMHLVHQGSSWFDGAFWVGANAVLRLEALQAIRTTILERGYRVPRFIHDRTVIEDTESTIDLVRLGWKVHNHPERLAWSATPPDYGSLLIQRRRWANGGLLIMPKLVGALARSPRKWLTEGIIRANYLVSIAVVNVALLVLLLVPFVQPLPLPALMATAVPYFLLYARDLRAGGRSPWSLANVYALNILLVPINLGGVLKSIQQGITRRRIPFGRTPKVAERTAAPAFYVWLTIGMIALWIAASILGMVSGHYVNAAFTSANALVLVYAVGRFAGWRHFLADGLGRS